MIPYFLAIIGGQIFAINKESVMGVGPRDDDKVQPQEEDGRKFLPLASADVALVCDLLPHLVAPGESGKWNHYLILRHQGLFMALPMRGKGRLVFVEESSVMPLPPAFTGMARQLVRGVLVNGADLLQFLNLEILAEVSDTLADSRMAAAGGKQ